MSIHVADDKKVIVKVPLGTPTFVAENFIHLQKSRWGSCSVDGNLNFNCLLVLMPPEVLVSYSDAQRVTDFIPKSSLLDFC